jgi:hypothetical protein
MEIESVQSKYELRDKIDEISNQIFHLERSNEELSSFLLEEPGEEEFILAISENNTIIENKRNEVVDLKILLCSIDAAYFKEHYNDELVETYHRRDIVPNRNSNNAQPVAVAIAVERDEVVSVFTTEAGSDVAEAEAEAEEGLYL